MSILLCKPGNGVWVANRERQERLDCPLAWPCAPCAGPGCAAVGCQQSRECLCLERRSGRLICRMPCVPGVCSMLFSPCGRYLYQLSSEADCVHTRCTATGELLYAAPAGVFPRCMKMGQEGRLLLCAGGAAGEAALLHAPQLTLCRRIATRHACFAADFWRDGLVLVCAEENGDIQTAVYTLPNGKYRPRCLLELPGPPGALCVCPDGKTALLSTRAGLSAVNLTNGALEWNCPEWALCMRLECRGSLALVSDTLDGGVWLIRWQQPSQRRLVDSAAESQACFL